MIDIITIIVLTGLSIYITVRFVGDNS